MSKSRVTFPDGTEVEISKDTPPEQIRVILSTLAQAQSNNIQLGNDNQETNKIIVPKLSTDELWEVGSKKDKLAIFVGSHFTNQWFTTTEVRDEQIKIVKRIVFGESSAISTYLNRLHEDGYLQKMKRRKVSYHVTEKLLDEYPPLQYDKIVELLHRD